MALLLEHPAPTIAVAPTPRGDSARLGDLVVVFGDAAAPPARRPDAPFAPVAAGAAWRAYEAPPAADWHGAPLTRVVAAPWTAWLIGELYATSRPAESVLSLLRGQTTPNDLNGHFLLLAHDAAADEWHVWTNRHATLHGYVTGDGRRAALGTSFRAVAAAASPALDWEGLTSFFALGYFAADRTYLAGVRTLRPATHYRLDGQGRPLSETRYWHWWHAPDTTRSLADTRDAFAERFQTVMGELTASGRVAVPISGGLDSRSTVATMRAGSPLMDRLWAYSYGYTPDSPETRIAARVAAARGLAFDAFIIRPYLFDQLPRVLGSIEGFQDVTQSRQAAVADAITAHSDYLIAAHWGDVYLDDMGVAHAPEPGDPVAVALYKFRKGGSDWLLEHVCRPHLGGDPEEVLRALLAEELRRVGPHDDPDFVIKALKTDQWSARWTTASLRMFQSAAFPRLPFYDTRLADFFCTVPTSTVARRRLQIEYLKHYAPDLARIPWQVTGRDLFSRGGPDPAQLARRAWRKGHARLRGVQGIERNWEVQFLYDGGRAGLNRWLLRLGRRLHDHVDVEDIRRLLNQFYRDPWAEKRGYAVSLLLTLSAWLDYMAGDLDE